MSEKAFFKDMYGERPFHYDCVLGKIELPWNGKVIDIFRDTNGPEPRYRPVVDGIYAQETYHISLSGDSFTEEDLNGYLKRVKDRETEIKRQQNEEERVLTEAMNIISSKVDPEFFEKLYCLEYWYYIHSEAHVLGYDVEKSMYYIAKFHPNQPIDRRFYFWNRDKDFEMIKSSDRDEIVDKFIELVTEEFKNYK